MIPVFIVRISTVQGTSEPPNTNQQLQFSALGRTTYETAMLALSEWTAMLHLVGSSPQKLQEAAGISQEVLCWVTLYEVTTSEYQQLHVRQTNKWASSVKTSVLEQVKPMPEPPHTVSGFIFMFLLSNMCSLTCVCFSKTVLLCNWVSRNFHFNRDFIYWLGGTTEKHLAGTSKTVL